MDSYQALPAWQKAHDLCLDTLRATAETGEARADSVFSQLRRAAIRIGVSIAKGYVLRNHQHFGRHVASALGYAIEVECLLNLAVQMEYLPGRTLGTLRQRVNDTLEAVYALLRSVAPGGA